MAAFVPSRDTATLDLPVPRLCEGRFSSCAVITDENLWRACGVRIAFTQRAGGVSAGSFEGLNLGTHVGDDPASVRANRQALFEALGIARAACVQPRQVHGDRIVSCIDAADVSSCARQASEGADGVVVTCDDVAALLCFADCTPVILVAPGGSFAVVHAGWRGVMAHIAEQALDALCARAGVGADRVNVYIGPHIRSCHFEVSPDLARRFADEFGSGVVREGRYVDMAHALCTGLLARGAAAERIADAKACTVCDGGVRYYSYRASGGVTGRHAALAVKPSL